MTSENEERFSWIQEEFARYFDTEFSDDAEDSRVNEIIRLKLRDFIFEAASLNDIDLVRRAIRFLLQNTGCEEDLKIYEGIKASLIAKSIVSAEDLIAIETYSPVNRWR